MPVLYSCTALLKKRRAAASLFSISDSSRLELLEVLVGLEVRIGLAQREQLAQSTRQHILGRSLRWDASRLRRDGCVASLDHRLQRAALMAGIPLHGFHQIWNEVMTLPHLHVDVGIGLIDPLPHGDEPVVDHDDPQHEQDDRADDDPGDDGG